MTIRRLKHLAGLLLALSVCACSGQKTLSAADIKIQIGTVRALAAATQLLCESFIKSATTETFVKTQASLIADKAKTAASDLEGNADAAEDTRRRGQMIATELQSVCRTLESDPNAAAMSIEKAAMLTSSASQLENTLESQQ